MTDAGDLARGTAVRSHLGLAAVALAAITWSLGAIAAGVLLERGVAPSELAQSRVLLTAIGFAAASRVVGPPRRADVSVRVRASGSEPVGGDPRVSWVHLVGFATALGLATVLFLQTIGRLGVAVGTVLHYLAPLLVVVWSAIAARRRPSAAMFGSAMASVAGVVLVSGALASGAVRIDPLGIAFGMASATCFAAYTVLGETVMATYGPVHALLRGFGLAAVGWLVYQIAQGWPAVLFAPGNTWLVLFVGLVGTLLPFLLFLWGVQRVHAQRAAISATFEPVVSGVVAWVVLGQALTPAQIAGAVMILIAVTALQVLAARREAVAPAGAGQSTSP